MQDPTTQEASFQTSSQDPWKGELENGLRAVRKFAPAILVRRLGYAALQIGRYQVALMESGLWGIWIIVNPKDGKEKLRIRVAPLEDFKRVDFAVVFAAKETIGDEMRDSL